MSDNEVAYKAGVIVAILVGIVALGYVVVYAVAPLFVAATVIDFGFRHRYNAKLDAIRKHSLNERPDIFSFEARMHEGRVMIGWHVDLPGNAQLDIYRLEGSGGGTVDQILDRGTCIHTTGCELTTDMSEVFFDDGLAKGTYFYVPVVAGMEITKEPYPYSFLSFARDVEYRTRKTRVLLRGEAVRVDYAPPAPVALTDDRDDASKLKDEVLEVIKGRRKMDAELDAAILRIQEDDDLSDEEKLEAVELLETRAQNI